MNAYCVVLVSYLMFMGLYIRAWAGLKHGKAVEIQKVQAFADADGKSVFY